MNSSVVLCRGNMACCLPQRQLADPAQRMDSAVTSAHEHNGSAAKKQAVQYSTVQGAEGHNLQRERYVDGAQACRLANVGHMLVSMVFWKPM